MKPGAHQRRYARIRRPHPDRPFSTRPRRRAGHSTPNLTPEPMTHTRISRRLSCAVRGRGVVPPRTPETPRAIHDPDHRALVRVPVWHGTTPPPTPSSFRLCRRLLNAYRAGWESMLPDSNGPLLQVQSADGTPMIESRACGDPSGLGAGAPRGPGQHGNVGVAGHGQAFLTNTVAVPTNLFSTDQLQQMQRIPARHGAAMGQAGGPWTPLHAR